MATASSRAAIDAAWSARRSAQVGQDREHEGGPPPLAERAELAQRDPELVPPRRRAAPSRWRASRGRTSPSPAATGHAARRTGRTARWTCSRPPVNCRSSGSAMAARGCRAPSSSRPRGDPGDALDQLLLDRLDVVGPARRQHRADHPRLGRRLGRRVGRRQREHLAGQRVALAVPELHPVVAQGPDEPQRRGRVAAGDRPAQRGVHVVLLGREQVEPAHLIGGAQQRVGGLGQLAEVARERVPGRGLLARLGQPLQRVGAHRLQHPVPRRRRRRTAPSSSGSTCRPGRRARSGPRPRAAPRRWPAARPFRPRPGPRRPARPRPAWRRRGRPPGGGRARARAPTAAASSSRRWRGASGAWAGRSGCRR